MVDTNEIPYNMRDFNNILEPKFNNITYGTTTCNTVLYLYMKYVTPRTALFIGHLVEINITLLKTCKVPRCEYTLYNSLNWNNTCAYVCIT